MANIQKIKYSVALMANPQKPDEPKKAYAYLQQTGTVSLAKLAQHIKEHGSPYGRDVILGVITAIVDCTKEFLSQGFKVDLGDLGAFTPSIKSEGQGDRTNEDGTTTPALKAFSSDNIIGLRVGYRMSEIFDDLRTEAEFQKVASRKAQAATEAAQLNGDESASWGDDSEEEGGEG